MTEDPASATCTPFWTAPKGSVRPPVLAPPTAHDIAMPNLLGALSFCRARATPSCQRLIFLAARRVATGKQHTDRAVGQVVGIDGTSGEALFSLHVIPRGTTVESCLTPLTGIQMTNLTGINATPAAAVTAALKHAGLGPDVCLVMNDAAAVGAELGLSAFVHFARCIDFADLFRFRDPLFGSSTFFDVHHLALADGCPTPQAPTTLDEARLMRWLSLRYCADTEGALLNNFIARARTLPPVPPKDEILRFRYDGVCLADCFSRCQCGVRQDLVTRQHALERAANQTLSIFHKVTRGHTASEITFHPPAPYISAVVVHDPTAAKSRVNGARPPRRPSGYGTVQRSQTAPPYPATVPTAPMPAGLAGTSHPRGPASAMDSQGRNVNATPWSPNAQWDPAPPAPPQALVPPPPPGRGGGYGRGGGRYFDPNGGGHQQAHFHHHHHGAHHHYPHQSYGVPAEMPGDFYGPGAYQHHHHHQYSHQYAAPTQAFGYSQQHHHHHHHHQQLQGYAMHHQAQAPSYPSHHSGGYAQYGFDPAMGDYRGGHRGRGGGMGRGRGGMHDTSTHSRGALDSDGAALPRVHLGQPSPEDDRRKLDSAILHYSYVNRKREQQQLQRQGAEPAPAPAPAPALDSGTTFRTFADARASGADDSQHHHVWASTPAGGATWDALLEED